METTNNPDKNKQLQEWVHTHSDALYSWALHKVGEQTTAEDLVQDCFLAALNSFENFKQQSSAKTWLFSILNNKINDFFRQKIRRGFVSNTVFLETFFDENGNWKSNNIPQSWAGDDAELLDNADFSAALARCMNELPEAGKAAIQLKYLSEKKGEEICQELEISTTNYWQLIHRAKLQLRACLELNWFKK